MSDGLINIGLSGTTAARLSLEVTAQNIANAQTEGYVRRRASHIEVASAGDLQGHSAAAYNGVRVGGIYRPDNELLQAEARRSSSSYARAAAELEALKSGEIAIEEAGFYDAMVDLEASLARLSADPLDRSIRAETLQRGHIAATGFNTATQLLDTERAQLRTEVQNSVNQINTYASELAKINDSLARSDPDLPGYANILDQRDLYLSKLSEEVGIFVETNPAGGGPVTVRLGDANGPVLVQGDQAQTLSASENSDGTVSFALAGAPVTPASGKIAGQASALEALRDLQADLDSLAASLITTFNTAQAGGTAPDGSAGQPFFSGSGAGDIKIALSSGDGIATAPAGAAVNSLDTTAIDDLRAALKNGGPIKEADDLLFEFSSSVRSRQITHDALDTIATNAQAELAGATEIDLDAEAANLVRFQQAFQASGRIMQAAAEIFETILSIR